MMEVAATSRLSRTLILACGWIGLLFLLAPLLVTFPVSVTTQRYLSMPDDGISFQHYAKLLTDVRWSQSIVTSLIIAGLTTLCATVLGTLCAIGLWRLNSRFTHYLRIMILAPLIVPPIVNALAFYRSWIDLKWLDSIGGVVVAHTIVCLPLVLITVSTSLSGFDRRIFSGAAFSFVTSWDEVVVVLFITSRQVTTLPVVIWTSLTERVDPAVAAISVVMIVATLAAVLVRLASSRS
jgi:putative spermidine/putrescine transport system permease protein